MIKSNRGSVLTQTLVLTAIIMVAIGALSILQRDQKSQSLKTISFFSVDSALNSVMDYVIFGIKQKYCFTADGLMMADTVANCNLVHPGSVERLVMSEDTESYIRTMVASKDITGPVDLNNIALKSIDLFFNFNSISTAHPVYPVIQQLKKERGLNVSGARIRLLRDENTYLPRSGKEVYVRISVELVDSPTATQSLAIDGRKLSLMSSVIVYPRELGTFALIVPNNLYLDKTSSSSGELGSISIPNFPAQAGSSNFFGLLFQSPVFVNRNVHLPRDTMASASSSYSPVTFAGRVHLGNGWIKIGGNNFKPVLSKMTDDKVFWHQLTTFGGFQGGIENDGGLDAGLDYFSKIGSAPPDIALMSSCIQRNNQLSSSTFLSSTGLGGAIKGDKSGTSTYYKIFLSQGNVFSPQAVSKPKSTWLSFNATSAMKNINVKFENGDWEYRPVLQVKVDIGGNIIGKKGEEVYLSDKNRLTFSPDVKGETKGLFDTWTAELKVLEGQLSVNKEILKNAQTKLDDALAANAAAGLEAVLIAPLQDAVKLAQDSVAATQAKYDKLQASIQNLQAIWSKPPVFELSVKPVFTNQGNLSLNQKTLDVKITNPESLIDAKGAFLTPKVTLTAMDATYEFGQRLEAQPENPKLLGSLEFSCLDSKCTQWSFPNDFKDSVPVVADETDYVALAQQCENSRDNQTSFGSASWDTSFAPYTRFAWNFAGDDTATAGKDPMLATLIFDSNNSRTSNVSFQVRSIVGNCIIKPTAEVVVGFLGCDKLTIEPRTALLRIYGTIIANDIVWDQSVFKSGIIWSSLYHPESVQKLRELRILAPAYDSSKTCDQLNTLADPVWNPSSAMSVQKDRLSCSPSKLREKANPFQYTAVDPDCGFQPGTTNTTCKNRILRYLVTEQFREQGI